jgi:hypothetical protein
MTDNCSLLRREVEKELTMVPLSGNWERTLRELIERVA